MELGYVTSKGKLTIPARLLKKYEIKPETKIICREEGYGIKIISAVTTKEVYSNFGFMKKRGTTLKAYSKGKKNNL